MSEHPGTPGVGTEIDLEITSMAHGGSGIARHEGRVVFVPGVLPGERLRARITESRPSFARAATVALTSPSHDRRAPACAAEGAGCCDFSHMTAERSRALKADVLRDQLRRVGGLADGRWAALVDDVVVRDPSAGPARDGSVDVVGGGAALDEQAAMRGWRTVARWHVGAGGRIGVRLAGTHEVARAYCSQVSAPILAAVEALEAATTAGSGASSGGLELPPGAEVALAEGDGGRVAVQWRPPEVVGRGAGRRGAGRGAGRRGAQSRRARSARGAEWRAAGTGTAAPHAPALPAAVARTLPHEVLPAWSWEVDAADFWQAHRAAPAAYAAHVRAAVRSLLGGRGTRPGGSGLRVWDLYGGVGTLGSAALDAAAAADTPASVLAVESSASAVTHGRSTAERRRARLEFVHGDVASWFRDGDEAMPDVVVTDPPRAGLGNEVVSAIAAAEPARIVHIGCDIAAFSRDVGAFARAGFEIESIEGIDAFPGTHHLEAVAHLVGRR